MIQETTLSSKNAGAYLAVRMIPPSVGRVADFIRRAAQIFGRCRNPRAFQMKLCLFNEPQKVNKAAALAGGKSSDIFQLDRKPKLSMFL